MLRVSPKQLALGTHATRGVPQGNLPTHCSEETAGSLLFVLFAAWGVGDQQHWGETSRVLIGTTGRKLR